MNLSYGLRLVCLLTLVAGISYASLQLILSLNAGFLLRRLSAVCPRQRERVLYLLQIAPALLAFFVAGVLCFPEYLRHEPGHAVEPVGWITLLLAATMAVWFGSALLRGLGIALRSVRFVRICQRSGRHVPSGAVPILASALPVPLLAQLGFFRPFIVIAAELLESEAFAPGALQIALDHERSHALHFDNWKLLSLCFLPRLPGDPWRRHWQIATDWAADDDAVGGNPARGLLLAEALVRTARLVKPARVICSALTSADTELAARVERLLQPPQASHGRSLLPGLAVLVFLAVGAAAVALPWMYTASEHILHLGGS